MVNSLKIMMVAGEASGDAHGAKLVGALRDELPGADLTFFGAAGPRMRDAGVDDVVRADELSIVGLAEIGRALPMFLKAARALKQAANERRPDAVVLVDFPEFNLKLAKSLKKAGFRVIYYISPQLWAWRKYRISTIKRYVDVLITILPFERAWYARRGVANVEYVGSPLAREVHADTSKEAFCAEHGIDPGRPIIALLPGSRHKERVRILPVMIEAAVRMRAKVEDAQFVVAANDERATADIENIMGGLSLPGSIKVVRERTYDLLGAADAAAIASGTATLEAGIIGTPMVIVYKTSTLNYMVFEPMIEVSHYGLINLIAEERLATELIQDDFTASATADELILLIDPVTNAKMRKKLKEATDKLGQGGASKRAAQAIVRLIG